MSAPLTKNYTGCDHIAQVFPEWKHCGRPVRVTAEIRRGGFARCPEHPVEVVWPQGE